MTVEPVTSASCEERNFALSLALLNIFFLTTPFASFLDNVFHARAKVDFETVSPL